MCQQKLGIDPFISHSPHEMSLHAFDLILLDLDGLLVDTELFHWKAYQIMCYRKGGNLSWDYQKYLQTAGSSATSIREQLQKEVPVIFEMNSWDQLYQAKKEALWELMSTSPIPLMKGVEEWIKKVSAQKPLAVVTHSPKDFVEKVRSEHPIFSCLDIWIFREMYNDPKPSPDCYLLACASCGVEPKKAIGFEDSLRGIDALDRAGCSAVLVNDRDSHVQATCRVRGLPVFLSFAEIPCC